MKKINNLLHTLRGAVLLMLASGGIVACSDDSLILNGGVSVDPNAVPTGALYCSQSIKFDVASKIITENYTEQFVYRLTKAQDEDVTVTIEVADQVAVNKYNDDNKLKNIRTTDQLYLLYRYFVFPETNYTLPTKLTLTVKAGQTESEPLEIGMIYDGNLLVGGKTAFKKYILPLRVRTVSGIKPVAEEQMLYYKIEVNENKNMNFDFPMTGGQKNIVGVAYIDLTTTQPQVVNCYGLNLSAFDPITSDFFEDNYMLFDIVNLLTANVKYNAETKLAELKPSADLLYVLDHADKYLRSIQKYGSKVCFTLKGGGDGIGFCNLNDEQRTSLVWQIKSLITKYNIDGVNLWDEGAKYGQAGMAAIVAESYTKFIKALREALPGKIITLSETGDQTAGLYQAHNGLEAGTYIDYAWPAEVNEYVNPWNSASTHKPIVGFADKGRWGPLAVKLEDTPDFNYVTSEDGYITMTQELRDEGCYKVLVINPIMIYLQGFVQDNFEIPYYPMTQICWPLSEDMDKLTWMAMPNFDLMKLNCVSSESGAESNGYGGYSKDW